MINLTEKIKKSDILSALFLMLTLLLVFYPEANKHFLLWDDESLISQYKAFLPINWESLVEIATSSFPAEYIPVTKLVWAIIILPMQWFSGSTWSAEHWVQPFVFVTLIFHFFNCLLIKNIFSRIFKTTIKSSDWKTWLPVFLYAFHPLQVEGIASVSVLREPLWIFFGLLSFNYYLADKLTPSILSFVLAILSKPTAIIMAPLIFLFRLAENGFGSFKSSSIKFYFGTIFFFSAVITIVSLKIHVVQEYDISIFDRIFYSADSFGFYLTKIIFPFNLTADYGRTYAWLSTQSWTIEMLASVFFMFFLAVLYLRKPKIRRAIVICTLLFVLPLIPVSGLLGFSMQVYSNVADHYAAFSIVAWAALFYWLVQQYQVMPYIIIPLCLLYGWESKQQTKTWENNETLATQILKINPQSFMAYNNLGLEWLRKGRLDDALQSFEKSIEINPKIQNAYLNSAYVLNEQNRYNEILTLMEKGRKNCPQSTEIRISLSQALEKLGQLEKAIDNYGEAKKDFPKNAKIHFKLGLLYWKKDQFKEAIEEIRIANELEPQNEKYNEALKSSESLYEKIKLTK